MYTMSGQKWVTYFAAFSISVSYKSVTVKFDTQYHNTREHKRNLLW